MDARIAVGNEIISLAQLKQTGKIQQARHSWVLPLDERSRGKITLGDMTILFQFVTPPPPQPRPQLPASVRGSITGNLDWFFTTIAGVSFLLHLLLVIYLRNVDWPRKPDIEEIPDRFVQMVIKKAPSRRRSPRRWKRRRRGRRPRRRAEEKTEKKKAAPAEEKKAKAEPTEEEKARAEAERRARLAEQVKSTGLLKLLGAKADGERLDRRRARQGRRRPRPGEGLPGRRRRRRRQRQRRSSARHQDGRQRLGPGGRPSAACAAAAASPAAAPACGRPRSGSPAWSRARPPPSTASSIPSIVAKEVRSRLGAIKACYERALKRNPNLTGKVVIHWTITAAGTVSGVDVENGHHGRPEVASCIKSLVARWRFPAPQAARSRSPSRSSSRLRSNVAVTRLTDAISSRVPAPGPGCRFRDNGHQ